MQIKMISVTFGKHKPVAHFWVYQWGFETEGGVRSCHLIKLKLDCFVLSHQFRKTCDWMVCVFNVAGIRSITVNPGKLQRPRDSIKGHIFVYCMGTCVYTNNALIKYL